MLETSSSFSPPISLSASHATQHLNSLWIYCCHFQQAEWKNLNHSIFHILIHILISYFNVFGMWWGVNITSHKCGSYIINSNFDWKLNRNFHASQNWIMSITFLTALDKTTHSASELVSVMLLWAFDCQESITTKTHRMKPLTLFLLTGSPE